MKWTIPHFGVSHLVGIPKTHQITLICRSTFHEVIMLSLRSETPFTAVKEFTGTHDECVATAVQWAATL